MTPFCFPYTVCVLGCNDDVANAQLVQQAMSSARVPEASRSDVSQEAVGIIRIHTELNSAAFDIQRKRDRLRVSGLICNSWQVPTRLLLLIFSAPLRSRRPHPQHSLPASPHTHRSSCGTDPNSCWQLAKVEALRVVFCSTHPGKRRLKTQISWKYRLRDAGIGEVSLSFRRTLPSSDPNEAKGSKMEPKVIAHPSYKVPIESHMELQASTPR